MPQAAIPHIDHVGSLLRPEALREARERILGLHDADHNLGAHANAELTQIENEHIRHVVKLQEDCGMPLVTDGEFRRRSWWTDQVLSFTGTQISYHGNLGIEFVNAAGERRRSPGIKISDRLKWQRSINADSFKFLQSIVTRAQPKVTLPGPPIIHFLRENEVVPDIYPSLDAFWADVVAAFRREIDELAKAGCRYLQIDECMLAWLCDPRHQDYSRKRGEDPDALIETYCRVIDEAIAKRPKDMTVALHSCRGNMNAFWGAEGGYEPVADPLFNRIGADYYLLEYDTPRAGDFAPLRHVPKGKTVLLGLVSTKEGTLEKADDLMRRIEAAAKVLDVSQLGLCPQCGFSTNLFGTSLTEDDERRKLSLIAEVGERVWG